MNTMSIRPRGIGEILDGAFRLYKEDVGLYVLTATLGALPFALVMIASTGDSDTALLAVVVGGLSAFVLTMVVWSALMDQMNRRLEGEQPTFSASMKRGLNLFFRVAWGAILAYFVLFAGMMVWMFASGLIAMLGGFVHEMVGVLLGVLAGIFLAVVVFFRAVAGSALFLPGIIVEGKTAYSSVKRGFALARGGHLRIVAVLLLSWILILVPLTATYFLTGTTAALVDPDAVANGAISAGQLAAQQLLAVVASGFTTPFLVACILLMHYDQRVRLEAFDLEAEAGALAG
ncbi:MAG: hypothetical protein R3253_00045 [Longimicrobiales bacterium]|nr:hypothetical protein [Longimicrobiales bacterium]